MKNFTLKNVAICACIFVVSFLTGTGVISAYNTYKTMTELPKASSAKIPPVVVSAPIVQDTIVSASLLPSIKDSPLIAAPRVIRRKVLPAYRTLFLTGPVSGNAVDLAARVTALQQMSADPIYLVLSSPGGSVITGNMLIAAIEASRAPVYTVCHILCASMAAMIHSYGKERYMTDRSLLMFHPATAGYEGDVDRIYSFIGTLKRYTNKIELDVATRAGLSLEKYKSKAAVELWMDTEDATASKFNDSAVSMLLSPEFLNNPLQSSDIMIRINRYNIRELVRMHPNDVIWIKENGTRR